MPHLFYCMKTAYLLTGGNLGNRMDYLSKAQKLTAERCGPVIAASGTYETAAWGVTDQPSFYNRLLVVETDLSPEQLMTTLLEIEEEMGRKRTISMGPRTIDLDILFIDNLVIDTALLVVPHPRLQERKFALVPLAEVAPQLIHPVLHKTMLDLLEECKDPLDVHKIL